MLRVAKLQALEVNLAFDRVTLPVHVLVENQGLPCGLPHNASICWQPYLIPSGELTCEHSISDLNSQVVKTAWIGIIKEEIDLIPIEQPGFAEEEQMLCPVGGGKTLGGVLQMRWLLFGSYAG